MCAPFDTPVNNRCFYFAKTEIKSDFKCVFYILNKKETLHVYLKHVFS